MLFKIEKYIAGLINFLRYYLSDIVYGATDGVITTFTIISGVKGAQLHPNIAIILGFVNLLADGLSMGAASFLSSRAENATKKLRNEYKEPFYHGLATFFAFILLGGIPLISYLLPGFTEWQFFVSCVMTALMLLLVGVLRAFVTKERWFQGVFEMLIIGGLVAIFAYELGYVFAHLISE